MSVDTTPEATTDARIPHPAWRLPVLGDVLGINIRTPLQNSVSIGRELGPIFERNVLGNRFVFASGADMVAELSDESRFAKHLAPGVKALRGIGGDGLFTAYNHEPNWGKAHNLLAPAFSRLRCARTTAPCSTWPASWSTIGTVVKVTPPSTSPQT